MNIYEALQEIKGGGFVTRPGWGDRVYLYYDGTLIMLAHNGFDTPYQPAHPDLFAEDWQGTIPTP